MPMKEISRKFLAEYVIWYMTWSLLGIYTSNSSRNSTTITTTTNTNNNNNNNNNNKNKTTTIVAFSFCSFLFRWTQN